MKPNSTLMNLTLATALALSTLALHKPAIAGSSDRVVKIAGVGAQSGVLRPFGLNSEAAIRAAAAQINRNGGVKLGDGAMAKIVVEYFDDRCDAQEGIAVARKIASEDWLAAIGTTCSSVVAPVFGILQEKAGDPDDSGLKLPIFTDVAMKLGLASISEWGFRNIPDEIKMYSDLFEWLKVTYPDAKTVYGGVEQNFVHSRQTWYDIMKASAGTAGYDVKGEAQWGLEDTNFTTQVREMIAADADVVVISAHPYTSCGVLMEMDRQGLKPKILIGLTSSSSPEMLEVCSSQAEGMIIPTSFAPVNEKAAAAARATADFKGYADLHSMAAWENLYMLKSAIESEGIMATPESVETDRVKIRSALSTMKQAEGLLGTLERRDDGESIKPFVFVAATQGTWKVIHTPQAQ